jgi:hypothetical protein
LRCSEANKPAEKKKVKEKRSMRYKTFLMLLMLVALILMSIGGTAFAANKAEVVMSKDGRKIYVTKSTRAVARAKSSESGLVTIFSNIGKVYPRGTYFCCESYSITGPKASGRLPEYWLAVAFTPTADHVVTMVEVAVNLLDGADHLVLSLNSDASGLPGASLKSWHLRSLPEAGSCCTVGAGEDRAGIPVTAGTQYWIVLSTVGANSDTYAGWNVEDVDQVDTYNVPVAYYCSDDRGGSCGNNDAWTLDSSTSNQGPAFAVLGR